MPDLSGLIDHWGYPAIFTVVLLGNVGLPVPEESVLVLAGYLVWRGELRLPLVVATAVASAVLGDNVGYWLGRRYGTAALARWGRLVLLTPARLETARRAVTRWGALAVFAARFVPGLRFAAGPVAGATGLGPRHFVVANLLGASVYVPATVGVGYGLGVGLGPRLESLRHTAGAVEHWVLVGAGLATAALLGARLARRARRARVRR